MYTYEEKKKAVDLFIKYDLSPAAVIHELVFGSGVTSHRMSGDNDQ